MSVYDVAIIGAGPGGYSAALRAAQNGLSTALTEKDDVGGTCLNRGCIPAKAWISAAETVDHAKHISSFSAVPFEYEVDFAKVVEKERWIVSQFRKALLASLQKSGVDIFKGEARFASANSIVVESGAGTKTVEFKNAVIATGTAPAKLFDVPPSLALDNTTVFGLNSAPESLLIVGAGAIGCEFATAMARFGVKVTLVEMMPSVLPMEDKDVSVTLARELKKLKIDVVTGARIESMKQEGEGVIATLDSGREITAEKALISIGRRFTTDALALDSAGVKTGAKGEVTTDDLMRSSAPHIFAVGDVAGKKMLAYTAYREGCFVADYVAGKSDALPLTPVPNAIFTIPEIGSVGLREQAAPPDARKGTFMFRALARAHAAGEISGMVKVIADAKTDRLLGVHIIGPRATDLIHIASVALAQGMTAESLGSLLFAHPTFSEAILEAAHDVHGKSIHK